MALSRSPAVIALRALGLGDLLTGVPALRGLRRALPDHRLVLATDPALSPLAGQVSAVDEVLPASGLAPLCWPGTPPEIAVNLHGSGPQSHQVLQALRPSRLVAFRHPGVHGQGPAWSREEHEVARWCRLVRSELNAPASVHDLLLPRPAGPRDGAVVVHPGAAAGSRRWPVERFAAVAAWIASRGLLVAVTGSARERTVAGRLCELAGLPASALLAGRTGLPALMALVASARLLVCGDTGVAHLATAYATPSVVLFGPTSPAVWGPPASGPHTVLWHGEESGDPHSDSLDPALARIQVDEVIAAAAGLLRAGSTTPPSARVPPATAPEEPSRGPGGPARCPDSGPSGRRAAGR